MKKKLKRVEGFHYLYRTESGAIVNTDDASYHAYKKKRDAQKNKDAKVAHLSNELSEAKKEISELKDLVRQLLNKEEQ